MYLTSQEYAYPKLRVGNIFLNIWHRLQRKVVRIPVRLFNSLKHYKNVGLKFPSYLIRNVSRIRMNHHGA